MILKEITSYLESIAPPSLQENYDNSGLIVGSPNQEIDATLICLDCTPDVVEEARQLGCKLIIAHHPIVFSGLKKINGKSYIERSIINAIKNDIAIYAIHTNLDNVLSGVNQKIAEKLGVLNTKILQPKRGLLRKLVTFVPEEHAEKILDALFTAGAGKIGNYDECSYQAQGKGSFRAGKNTNPFVGSKGKRHYEPETRIEVILPEWLQNKVIQSLIEVHPYEEVAYDIYTLDNLHPQVGSGLIGSLPQKMDTLDFLALVKKEMKAGVVRHTEIHKAEIQKIALCGGSGSFLLKDAIASGADVFVTADFKYHQFFDAENKIIIADIGHFESEQFTIELLRDYLSEKFPKFATHLTNVVTNPVRYL